MTTALMKSHTRFPLRKKTALFQAAFVRAKRSSAHEIGLRYVAQAGANSRSGSA